VKKLYTLLDKSRDSKLNRSLLYFALNRAIPFNRPHGIKIIEVNDLGIKAKIPYWKINQNHLKGLHACALATLSEFTSGMTLTHRVRSGEFRLIMKELNMVYHYQGKTAVIAACELSNETIQKEISDPLKTQDATYLTMMVETYDEQRNHISTGKIVWQIKKWDKVKSSRN
jgi:acyl-coenzyme A thioesterase PaaI-like protein